MVLVVGGARYLTTDDDNYEENPNASPTGGKSTSGSKMGPDRNSSSLSMLPSVVEEDGQNQRQHPHPLMLHSIDDGNQLPAFNILLQELAEKEDAQNDAVEGEEESAEDRRRSRTTDEGEPKIDDNPHTTFKHQSRKKPSIFGHLLHLW